MAKRVSVAPTSGLALEGKSSPKLRTRRKSDIDDDKVAIFFATLTETCNVVRSAKAAGFTANWAYRKRKSDAAFRNGWAAAVREGYARLELVLLERAIKGTPKLVKTARGSDRVMRDYSTALAVALLRRHAEMADSASHEPGQEDLAEIRERILERLDKLRARDGAGPIENKSAAGRLDAIEAALRFEQNHSTAALKVGKEPLHQLRWSPSPATAGEDDDVC